MSGTSKPAPANATDRIANLAAQLARRTPREVRDLSVRGPARQLTLTLIFKGMERRFDRVKAGPLETVVHWEVGDLEGKDFERWQLAIADGRCRASRKLDQDPRATIRLAPDTFLDLATGQAQGPQLYVTGQLRLTGDLMLAQRLTTLFKVPGR